MVTEGNSPHLPSLLDGMTLCSDIPNKALAAEMGYSETHFSRIREERMNDVRFALKYARAIGTLIERQRLARYGKG